jgi:DNA-binding CsgD family transcriptional regulator
MQKLTSGLGPLTDPAESLTPRERELFRLIGLGRSARQVALELGISVKTVNAHRTHIKEKLSLNTISDLVRAAVEAHGERGVDGLLRQTRQPGLAA